MNTPSTTLPHRAGGSRAAGLLAGLSRWARLPETLAVYAAADRESGQIRAAHLHSVMRLTPFMMAANVCSGALMVWAFRPEVPTGMWAWLAVLYTLAAAAMWGWSRTARQPRATVSARAIRRATWHAGTLAGVWAVLPLCWFAQATPSQQLFMATLVTGMLSAGGFVLSPLAPASLVYVAVYTLAAVGSLGQTGEPLYIGVAMMLFIYSSIVVIGCMSASRKATALLRSQAQALRQERMMAVLLHDFEQNASEALWETRVDGRITHHSPRLAELLGVSDVDLAERSLLALLEQLSPNAAVPLRAALDAGRPFKNVRLTVRRGEVTRHWSINGKRLCDEDGRTTGWRGVLADVTDEVLGHERLEQLAHTDSLTGLANRLTLHEALRASLGQGHAGALLTLDLDHFKTINDTLGHAVGDEVLKVSSRRLVECVRAGDLVARLGGDEFAVLMRRTADPAEAISLAQRLIVALQAPIDFGGRRLRVGASVGVAPHDGQGAIGIDELLVHADMALYDAKETGRGRHTLYSPALGEHSRRRLAIEQGLRQAIALGQLSLHWQPKVDIASWQVVGAEALLRWDHPELGRVGPAEFIPIAEKSEQIQHIGTWVLQEACRVAASELRGLTVSVNVSPAQLCDGDYTARVRQALQACRLDPTHLELEITESVFMDDVNGALEQLHALHQLGVRIALDDFGTGYSSLAYLRRFPFDTLKIDRAFVHELLLRHDARAIVQMISELAATLGMRTIAEGVETPAQLEALREAGCNEVQGYMVSAPRPLAGFNAWRRSFAAASRPESVAA